MRRKKPINADLLVDIEPLTKNQEKFLKNMMPTNTSSLTVVQAQAKHLSHSTKPKQVLSDDNPYEKDLHCSISGGDTRDWIPPRRS